MKSRIEHLEQAKSKGFDLVVIGAGIIGAGIAQNAASRGLSVLLVDKDDFAAGASCKTSQLLHGGVPQEQLQFKVNKGFNEEHDRLRRLAPHLIKEIPFVLPLLNNNTLFNLKATAGLTLNEVMSLSSGQGNTHAYLTKKKLANLVPAVSTKLVRGGIQYHEALSDDARLVMAVIKAAHQKGATIINYVQATGLQVNSGRVVGVEFRDRYSGKEFSVACKACVNATGVFSEQLSDSLRTGGAKAKMLTYKSTQIIVPASAFETNNAILLPARDGSFVYVLPWHHALLIGATESIYKGDLNHPRCNKDEIDYLLQTVNTYTETHKLNGSDIKSSFAGLKARLCLDADLTGPSSSSGSIKRQEWIIGETTNGLFSVISEKFDNYRVFAAELMDLVVAKVPGLSKLPARTGQEMLGAWDNKEDFLARSTAIETKARRLSIEPGTIQHLIANYGSEAEAIVDLIEKQDSLKDRIISDFPPVLAEVAYTVVAEMAVSLQDFMLRRTRLGVLNNKRAMAAAPQVAEIMAALLSWDAYRTKLEIQALESAMFEQHEEANTVSL